MSDETSLTTAAAAFEQKLVSWARGQNDVQAVLLVGSRARPDGDAWADFDVVMVVDAEDRYLDTTQWLRALGEVVLTYIDTAPDEMTLERRALFHDGIDVDFAILSLGALEVEFVSGDTFLPVALQRGYRILLDRIGLEARLPSIIEEPFDEEYDPPDEEVFVNMVSSFWHHAARTAKRFRRGETYAAWSDMVYLTQKCLLPAIEWHAKSVNGPEHDTWYDGRFIEQWADPEIVSALPGAIPGCSTQSIADGLTATMELFSRLAREVASDLDYLYPDAGEARIRELVEEWLGGAGNKETA